MCLWKGDVFTGEGVWTCPQLLGLGRVQVQVWEEMRPSLCTFAAVGPPLPARLGVASPPLDGEQTSMCVWGAGVRFLGSVMAQTQAQPQSQRSSRTARGGGRKESLAV